MENTDVVGIVCSLIFILMMIFSLCSCSENPKPTLIGPSDIAKQDSIVQDSITKLKHNTIKIDTLANELLP